MELRVHLKVCEGCGCLWLRLQTNGGVYCRICESRLRDFPSPERHRRPGRGGRNTRPNILAAVEEAGGAQ